MRVAGRRYTDGVRNLEVMLESLSGGRRREIQEDGIVMEVKNLTAFNCLVCLFFECYSVILSCRYHSLFMYVCYVYFNKGQSIKINQLVGYCAEMLWLCFVKG